MTNHILQTSNQISEDLENLAEVTSPCPDLPERLWTRDGYPRNARESTALLCILPLVARGTRNVDLYLDLLEHVKRMSIQYGEQAKWQIVRDLLSNYHAKSPAQLLETVRSTMSNEAWYGNMVPELRRAIRSMKLQRLDYSVVADKRPVRKSRRKRGYDDKGTYQRDPWPQVPVPDKKKVEVNIPDPPSYRLWQRYTSQRGR